MRLALEKWLSKCVCENINHELEDCRAKKDRNVIYLRPAINHDLKSDVNWLTKVAEKNPDKFVDRVSDQIFYNRHEYDYEEDIPILCLDCAEERGLVKIPNLPVVTLPAIVCKYCGDIWNPASDPAPGIYMFDDKNKPICLVCAIKQNKDVNKVVTDHQRKSRRKLNAEKNDETFNEYIAESVCASCGEDENDKIKPYKSAISPAGTLGQWRRDCGPEEYKKRLYTTEIYCDRCTHIHTT